MAVINIRKRCKFSWFCHQGVLDYLDQLTTAQIRKLYSMLSVLGFKNAGRDSLLQVCVVEAFLTK